jgi:hypothetical protein
MRFNKTTLSNARQNVLEHKEFYVPNPKAVGIGSVYGEYVNDLYCVFSYGYHFPMFVYDKAINEWLGNMDRYSPTTSKQMGKCHPHDVSKWLSTDQLVQIVNKGGYMQYLLLKEMEMPL